tara:strand:- start:6 stop:275 length:270 start_codon:yes stop_codon:yes gene_type:complete
MKKIENIKGINGWLIDPHDKWAIHIDFKNESNDHTGSDFNIDMWGVVSGGKAMEFKSRRKASKSESIKIWNQLVACNWVELDLKKIKVA